MATWRKPRFKEYVKIFRYYAGDGIVAKTRLVRYGDDWRRVYSVGVRTTKKNIELIKAATKELEKPSSLRAAFVQDILTGEIKEV